MKTNKHTSEYTAFFEKNENDGYTITVPSLPGLVTEGRTFEESVEMAKEAVICYLSGLKKAELEVLHEHETGSHMNLRHSIK